MLVQLMKDMALEFMLRNVETRKVGSSITLFFLVSTLMGSGCLVLGALEVCFLKSCLVVPTLEKKK